MFQKKNLNKKISAKIPKKPPFKKVFNVHYDIWNEIGNQQICQIYDALDDSPNLIYKNIKRLQTENNSSRMTKRNKLDKIQIILSNKIRQRQRQNQFYINQMKTLRRRNNLIQNFPTIYYAKQIKLNELENNKECKKQNGKFYRINKPKNKENLNDQNSMQKIHNFLLGKQI